MIRCSIFLILLSLTLSAKASKKAEENSIQCWLEEVTIEIDADGDVHRAYNLQASLTITKSGRGTYAEAFKERFFVSARYHQGEIRMFIRDKKHLTASESNQHFEKESELMLSDPGAYTQPGLKLTCKEN